MKKSFNLLLILTCCSFKLFSQTEDRTISEEFYNRIDGLELNYHQKDSMLNNLRFEEGLLLDTVEVAEIYYSLFRSSYSSKSDAESFAEKIYLLGKDWTPIDSVDIFERNLVNYVNLKFINQDCYTSVQLANEYFRSYSENSPRAGKVYRVLGKCYDVMGNKKQAQDYLDKSIEVIRRVGTNKDLLNSQMQLLRLYAVWENESFYEQAKVIMDSIENVHSQSVIKTSNLAGAYLNMGAIYENQDSIDDAMDCFNQSLELSLEINDYEKVAKSLINIGRQYKESERLSEAIEYLNKAKQYTDGYNSLKASIQSNLADVNLYNGDFENALRKYSLANSILLGDTDAVDDEFLPTFEEVLRSPDKQNILDDIVSKGICYVSLFESNNESSSLDKAAQVFDLADQLVDSIFDSNSEDLSKLFWRNIASEIYSNAMKSCYYANDFQRAFYYMEKNSSLMLLSNVNEYQAKRTAGIPEEILKEELYQKLKINRLEKDIKELKTASLPYDSLIGVIFESKAKFKSFCKELEENYPKYKTFKTQYPISNITKTQSILSQNGHILQYVFGEDFGFIMHVTKEKVTLTPIENFETLEAELAEFKVLISEPFSTREDQEEFEALSKLISGKILPPDLNAGSFVNAKFNVITSGILNEFPFDALLVESRTENGNWSYLVETTEVAYWYSSSLELFQREIEKRPSINTGVVSFIPEEFNSSGLKNLSASSVEYELLKDGISGDHFYKEKATKDNFLSSFGSYDLVHVSTHAGAKNETPWIAFSDGNLGLEELYFGQHSTKMVVLSACQTATGEEMVGEGSNSLARAFVNSGVQSVISSLWSVNEQSTQDITLAFYDNLKAGDNSNNALWKAKLAYLNEHRNTSLASPYYWSGIVSIGSDQESLNLTKDKSKWWLIVMILSGLAGVFFIRKRLVS